MVQEVQTQGNWYQTPNRIEWIWYTERKVSDYTQIRDKISNTVIFTSNKIPMTFTEETFAESWTYTTDSGKYYKLIGWDIYFTDSWSFLVDYIPDQTMSNVSTPYTLRVYLDDKVVYQLTTRPSDKSSRQFTMRVWLKNKITASLITENDTHPSPAVWLRFTKL